MSLSFGCVFCGKKLRASAEAVGKKVRCPNCNRSFVLVAASPQQPALPAKSESMPVSAATIKPPHEPRRWFPAISPRLLMAMLGGVAVVALAVMLGTKLRKESQPEEAPLQVAMKAVVEIRGDKGLGSGFLYESPELVVTNYHVVAGQEQLEVYFPDESHVTADGFLIASPEYDVAVLHLPHPAPSGAYLRGSRHLLNPGDEVFALGSPKGLSQSVTKGVVSSYRRDKDLRAALARTTDNRTSSHGADATWIQTSAPISKGNSGGPLIAADGTVVGINTWQLSADAGQNLNFALAVEHIAKLRTSIPSMRVRAFAELPVPNAGSNDRPLTPEERNLAAWGWQAGVMGRWCARNSFLNLPLATPAEEDEEIPVGRLTSELVNQLRACARRTFEDAEELQRIPKDQLAADLVDYIEDLANALADVSKAYTEAANTLYPLLRTGNDEAFAKWQDGLLKPQRDLNDLTNTSGAAVKKRLEATLGQQLWWPITFTPRDLLWLCVLEDRVAPETFSAVFTGTPRAHLFPTYYRQKLKDEAVLILQFVMKDTKEGSEPHELAAKLLKERNADVTESRGNGSP
jgi:S1-C subfamily serine protease